jgi:hypothetical protein
MEWRTYLVIYFGTKDKKPSEISEELERIGFVTTLGAVDFIYEWEKQPTKEEVLALGDRVSEALKDSGVVFNLDTHN